MVQGLNDPRMRDDALFCLDRQRAQTITSYRLYRLCRAFGISKQFKLIYRAGICTNVKDPLGSVHGDTNR